ncbi:MAG TPA: hypothetical protein VD816_19060 [Ohtaekwangia sp.]|nr:hypothetical protein [Ohtaekwangia sp.]
MIRTVALILFALLPSLTFAQREKLAVIAYYSGGPETTDSLAVEKLTHIIFSFCHLQGNKLAVDNKRDSVTLNRLVATTHQENYLLPMTTSAPLPSRRNMSSIKGWAALCSGKSPTIPTGTACCIPLIPSGKKLQRTSYTQANGS